MINTCSTTSLSKTLKKTKVYFSNFRVNYFISSPVYTFLFFLPYVFKIVKCDTSLMERYKIAKCDHGTKLWPQSCLTVN